MVEKTDCKYMARRKFYIPESEYIRDYRDGHEKYASNFLFDSDYDEVNYDDKDTITTEQ